MIKRIIWILIGIVLLTLLSIVLWFGFRWFANGGWPASGPTGEALPAHIRGVTPSDGKRDIQPQGFCVQFYFAAGNGLGEKAQSAIRYYLDGREVSSHMFEAVELEYPISQKEPCYRAEEPLRNGWHTLKVRYEDNRGQPFEYTWLFEALP